MNKNTYDYTPREEIIAKADVVRDLPVYREILSFDEWSKEYWRFDAEQYANDSEYTRMIDSEYERYSRSRSAYNAILDRLYKALT